MIPLAEMRAALPMIIDGGTASTTTDVWNMLAAARTGDLESVERLTERCAALARCRYDYTSPLHLAVREGHLDVVRFIVNNGGHDPEYRTHPFLEPLLAIAEDRGFDDIANFLNNGLNDSSLTRKADDNGKIDHQQDAEQLRFQEFVDQGKGTEAEAMLKSRPDLASNELAFWGEGILSMPAKDGDLPMLEMLLDNGATVPDLSKWGERYYFKHAKIAQFLLERSASPNHSNWHRTTVLHDKVFRGDLEKVALFIDHGADINAVDEEFCSTPLGFAARWGQREIVEYLIEKGADINRAGAEWATPLAWARKKGHTEIEADLLKAGA